MKGIKVIYTAEQFKEMGFDGEIAKYMRENKNSAIVWISNDAAQVVKYNNFQIYMKYLSQIQENKLG